MRMSFGEALRVTVFGSSHGPEVGSVVEGLPPGLPVDLAQVQAALDRRRPVGRRLATRRAEPDRLVLTEGISDGRTTGGPVVGYVRNEDVRRGPYRPLEDVPRPGHADYPAQERYDGLMDLSGGGIFSGRMTVGLVLAGALVRPYLTAKGVSVLAFTRSIHDHSVPETALHLPLPELEAASRQNELGAPDALAAQAMAQTIEEARRSGDSVGGIIEARAEGLPAGLGEPFFDPLEGSLAHALFAIPAIKGVEFGSGFSAAGRRGSENNDPYEWVGGELRTRTNHAGGILGGLATGMPLVLRVVVKPTSSIAREQDSVSLSRRTPERLVVTGRHDPCIVPRAVPVVEHVTGFVLADFLLRRGRA